VQPPCVIDGANPITAGVQGTGAYRAYGKFVRINVTGATGTGTGSVIVYGYRGLTANAGGGGGGSAGPAGPTGATGPAGATGAAGSLGPSAMAHSNTTQSISSNTATAISFNVNDWDTGSIHSTTVNPTRFIAPSDGYYLASCQLAGATSGTGVMYGSIYLNGAVTNGVQGGYAQAFSYTNVSQIMFMSASDYMECVVKFTNGAVTVPASVNFGQLTKLSTTFASASPPPDPQHFAVDAQWLIPVGQWGIGNSDLHCVVVANTYKAAGSLSLVMSANAAPIPSCPGGVATGDQGASYGPADQPYNAGNVMSSSFSFQYGVIKARAKIPYNGVHAGIWVLGTGCAATQRGGDAGVACPGHPEIDVLDYLPGQTGPNFGVPGYYNGSSWVVSTESKYDLTANQWHEYTLTWTASTLTWSVDGVTKKSYSPSPSESVFPWLTVEIDSGTSSGRATSYPVTMLVDYIRICSDPTAACADGDPTMIFQDEFRDPA
jgi:hypothetical protein